MTYKLIHGDCFEEMAKLESGSFDLILTDPPYGTMKGCSIDSWEKRGEKAEWDKTLPPETIFYSCLRLLRQNGKLILFSQEPYTSELVNKQITDIPFCYKAIWIKNVPANILMSKSAMVSYYEEILIFQKLHDTGLLNPLRGYFRRVLDFIGAQSCKVINMEFKVPRAWEIPNKEWANIVMRNDIDSISACDAVVLLYYGDYGATQPGTCFECGYAFAKGIPVIGVAMTRDPVSLMLGSAFRAMLDGLKGLESYDFRKMPKTNPIRELI